MSDEEMKAMLNLEHIVEYWEPDDEDDELANIEYNSIKVAVNLIYKLQKENEELKEKYENINWYFENQKDNFVHKNKIREKLKKLRKEEDRISKLNYELEPEKAIDSLLLRIGDLEELLEGE